MSEFDFLSKSKRLLRQLNWYLFHILVYLVVNMLLVWFIMDSPGSRWPVFFPILLWTIGLIIHGLKMNNIDLFKGRKSSVVIKSVLKIGGGY